MATEADLERMDFHAEVPGVAYLTDGKRLVEVVLVEESHDIIVHDCFDVDDGSTFTIRVHELGGWRVIDPEAVDAAA